MPNSCFAGCYRTSTDKSDSFHQFPKKDNQRHEWHDWKQFVRTTSGDFTGPGLSHTHRTSLVCNENLRKNFKLLCLAME